MIPFTGEKLICGIALFAAAVSYGWVWRVPPPPRSSIDTPASRAAYRPQAEKPPIPDRGTWNEPVAQSGGRAWIYDLFTPPDIVYDSAAHRLRVTAPALPQSQAGETEPFGLELRAVTRPLFRLQLVGYAGGPDDCAGVFENTLRHETFLARAGQALPDLGLRVQSLAAGNIPLGASGNTGLFIAGASARIRDEHTGEEFQLTTAERHRAGPPVATLVDRAGNAHELRAGESLLLGDATYRVDRLALAPAAAVVTKRSPKLKSPRMVTLGLPSATPQPPR